MWDPSVYSGNRFLSLRFRIVKWITILGLVTRHLSKKIVPCSIQYDLVVYPSCIYNSLHPLTPNQVGLRKHQWTKLMEVMEFQLNYFKSWKMMLWKCCTQYAANLGNSAVATGLEKVSFHSNAKERQMPKSAQTTARRHSSHTLIK